jgi:hypothetical protein
MNDHTSDAQDAHALSPAELRRLTEAVISGNDGCIEEAQLHRQLARVVEWAETNRIEAAALRLVLLGQMNVRVQSDGEIEYRVPGYSQEDESS